MEHQIRFGVFELDPAAGQLRKSGVPVPLSGQPLDVLMLLVRRPGEVVTREELKEALWPDETFVDFDNGVNSAIRRIRRALDDSPSSPRFLETLPKRGYRFIAPVGLPGSALAAAQPDRDDGAGETAVDLAAGDHGKPSAAAGKALSVPPVWRRAAHGVLTAVLALALVGVWIANRNPRDADVLRTKIQLPHVGLARGTSLALSPDGKLLACVRATAGTAGGQRRIYLRQLSGYEDQEVKGTESPMTIFFSPDGHWLGFFETGGLLKKVPINGGMPITIREYNFSQSVLLRTGTTASWGADNMIYIGGPQGLQRVNADGGEIEQLTTVEPDSQGTASHNWPQLLPGGDKVFFTEGVDLAGRPAILSLRTGELALIDGAPQVRWARIAATGHLIAVHDEQLLALPLNKRNDRLTGPAVPLGERLWVSPTRVHVSVSDSGTLIYVPSGYRSNQQDFVWVDRQGIESRIPFLEGIEGAHHRLSPDNRWLAIASDGIWKYDLERGGRERLANGSGPAWKPDGSGLASVRNPFFYDKLPPQPLRSNYDLQWIPAGGEAAPQPLYEDPLHEWPTSWSPDGQELAFQQGSRYRSRDRDIRILHADGSVSTFLATEFDERQAEFSPNGKWIAYVSDESGADGVYVRAYPSGDHKTRVSSSGGRFPAWSPAGGELFYLDGNRMMAVSAPAGDSLSHGRPLPLFERLYLQSSDEHRNYDVSRDGQRFIMVKGVGGGGMLAKAVMEPGWRWEYRTAVTQAILYGCRRRRGRATPTRRPTLPAGRRAPQIGRLGSQVTARITAAATSRCRGKGAPASRRCRRSLAAPDRSRSPFRAQALLPSSEALPPWCSRSPS